MPIKSFNIQKAKKIDEASCDQVPRFMIIAGPNGVGKSTLLYELRKLSDKIKGSGKILYVGPHRAWRKRPIKASWLYGADRDFSSILNSESIPGFEGMSIQDSRRMPDSTDEAPGFVKYILAQIETRRQNAIVSEIDKNELKFPEGYAPDIYKPLKDMLKWLIPHVRFKGIDLTDRNDVKCILVVEGVSSQIDIDDLSSGEKAVIALLMPLIERQIITILRRIEKGKPPTEDVPDTVMVIDEPDLHIHSSLQKMLVEYMRKRANEENVQFIIATHSPTIINEANSEELFVLSEKSISETSNQLHRVLSNQEKLDLYKNVCGDVAILTLGRPIVFVEGKSPDKVRGTPSDQRILELLCDEARNFTFIPLGGKEEVEKATLVLNHILSEKLVGFPTFAIVDRDLDVASTNSSSILKWEFCTVENMLLDPDSIFEVLEPYKEKTGISSRQGVETELLKICTEIKQDEIDKRVRGIHPSFHLHFEGKSLEKLIEERDTGMEKLKLHFSDTKKNEEIVGKIRKIEQDVDAMIQDKTAFMKFNGKAVMRKFLQKNVWEKSIDMNLEVFCYNVAERIAENGRLPESVKKVLESIKEKIKNPS